LNGGTEEPGHATRVASGTSTGFSTPPGILIDSADQGFDPNAHIGGLLTDTADDLGYSQDSQRGEAI
jgi:hypothetical protein